jgi:hypothetical protein
MVTDKDKDNAPGRTIAIVLVLALLMIATYVFWPIA